MKCRAPRCARNYSIAPKCSELFHCPKVLGKYRALDMCSEILEHKLVLEIWRMKEYGDEKTWTKDYVIKRKPCMLKLPDILHGSMELNKPFDIQS